MITIELSIITINRNNAAGLHRTIESVVAQQQFDDFEYVIVDGASTDGSQEVVESFRSGLADKLNYLSEPDKGIYEAMNKGIGMARGEYLLFLNSGDFLVDERTLQDVFATKHEADFLLGRCNISENGQVIHTIKVPERFTFGELYHAGIAHQATFIKKAVFEQHGLYREDFRYNSDIEFWYRTIALAGCSTETIPVVVADYNTEGLSSTESQSAVFQAELREIYAHPRLQFFIPDYDAWASERKAMTEMRWAKSKKSLYAFVKGVYKAANQLAKLRK